MAIALLREQDNVRHQNDIDLALRLVVDNNVKRSLTNELARCASQIQLPEEQIRRDAIEQRHQEVESTADSNLSELGAKQPHRRGLRCSGWQALKSKCFWMYRTRS